jgi:hypothetical protein
LSKRGVVVLVIILGVTILFFVFAGILTPYPRGRGYPYYGPEYYLPTYDLISDDRPGYSP